jgi:hypothetical protein
MLFQLVLLINISAAANAGLVRRANIFIVTHGTMQRRWLQLPRNLVAFLPVATSFAAHSSS